MLSPQTARRSDAKRVQAMMTAIVGRCSLTV
jgi:hypothetical protein